MNPYANWFLKTRLKTRQLLLIIAIDDERNIHKAADVLNMTQPAASKLLKDLEEVLGVELFERHSRGMFPTVYGDTLIRNARIALSTLNLAHDEIQSLKKGILGNVRLGAITSPGIVLIPEVIVQLQQESPGLRINFEINSSNVLIEKLVRGELDIVVARLSPKDDQGLLNYSPINKEPVSVVCRPGHILANYRNITMLQLMNEPWIVAPVGSAVRFKIDLMVQELNLPHPVHLIETSSLLFTTKMMQHSDMLTIMGSDVARYYQLHGMASILPVELPFNMDLFGLVTRRDLTLSPASKLVLQCLEETADRLYGASEN
jgi:DNA-binding transcriptional LysR family regulator